MKKPKKDEGVYPDQYGFRVVAIVGKLTKRKRYPRGTAYEVMRAWRQRALAELRDLAGQAQPMVGSARAELAAYWRDADITPATAKVRVQQFEFWFAQPAAVGAPVFTPAAVRAAKAADVALHGLPQLGDLPRAQFLPKRLREILKIAFTAPADAPTKFANTSNNYRTGLYHFFTILDQDVAGAINPLDNVKVRPRAGAQKSGQDARDIAAILRCVPTTRGRPSHKNVLWLNVLAWVHITPQQLKQFDPRRDFHDVPDATRAEMIAGAITITKQPRLKGKKDQPIPPPETIPLTPYGVAAMRAFAADPTAWGPRTSLPSLNKAFKRAARTAQAQLAAKGIVVDFSRITLYHLKHSLATTASLASAGVVDRSGRVKMSAGVQRALDHAASVDGRITAIYTQAAVAPILRHVNAATSLYLDHLFKQPRVMPSALRVVQGRA